MDEIKTRRQVITRGQSSLGLRGTLFIPHPFPEEEPRDKPLDKLSYLGTPIYSSLVFKAVTSSDQSDLPNDVREIVSTDLELTEILVTVHQTKNIVRTPLNGRDGTVKEYISKGDYAITVEGMIVNQNPLQFPKEDAKKISSFIDLEQSLEVGSNFLSLWGITKIVVNDYSFNEIEGTVNEISFRLMLWSDTDFKIEPTQNAVT
jgi:hypothetical protein